MREAAHLQPDRSPPTHTPRRPWLPQGEHPEWCASCDGDNPTKCIKCNDFEFSDAVHVTKEGTCTKW